MTNKPGRKVRRFIDSFDMPDVSEEWPGSKEDWSLYRPYIEIRTIWAKEKLGEECEHAWPDCTLLFSLASRSQWGEVCRRSSSECHCNRTFDDHVASFKSLVAEARDEGDDIDRERLDFILEIAQHLESLRAVTENKPYYDKLVRRTKHTTKEGE